MKRTFHPNNTALLATIFWAMLPALFLASLAIWFYWNPPQVFRWVSPETMCRVLAVGAVLAGVYGAMKIPLSIDVHRRPLVIDDNAVYTLDPAGKTDQHIGRELVGECVIMVRPSPISRTDHMLILKHGDGTLGLNYVLSILSRADEQAAIEEIGRWSPVPPGFIQVSPR